MPKRFHAGHGLALGFVAGIVAAGHRIWFLLFLAFVAGALAVLASQQGVRLFRWLGSSASPLSMRAWRMLMRRVRDLRPDDRMPL